MTPPADPVLRLLLAGALAALFGSPARDGRPRAALLGAAAASALAWSLGGLLPGIAGAALLGAAVAWLAPVQGPGGSTPWAGEAVRGAAGRLPAVRPSQLVDPADRLRIEAAVLEAERGTAGELAVRVVGACDPYASAGWRGGVLLAALAGLGLAVLRPDLPLAACLAAQAAGLAAGHALCRIGPLRRRLVRESLMEARVHERARRVFAESGLARTPGRTGILIFAALFEGRVLVVAGEGIDKALEPGETWDEVVAAAADGLGCGRAADGLVAAVKRCGEILAEHLPGPLRPVEDLPDAVVLEDGAR